MPDPRSLTQRASGEDQPAQDGPGAEDVKGHRRCHTGGCSSVPGSRPCRSGLHRKATAAEAIGARRQEALRRMHRSSSSTDSAAGIIQEEGNAWLEAPQFKLPRISFTPIVNHRQGVALHPLPPSPALRGSTCSLCLPMPDSRGWANARPEDPNQTRLEAPSESTIATTARGQGRQGGSKTLGRSVGSLIFHSHAASPRPLVSSAGPDDPCQRNDRGRAAWSKSHGAVFQLIHVTPVSGSRDKERTEAPWSPSPSGVLRVSGNAARDSRRISMQPGP